MAEGTCARMPASPRYAFAAFRPSLQGRTGRTCDGVVYRLLPRKVFLDKLPQFESLAVTLLHLRWALLCAPGCPEGPAGSPLSCNELQHSCTGHAAACCSHVSDAAITCIRLPFSRLAPPMHAGARRLACCAPPTAP